jgi:hypothetical protein
MRDYIYTIRAFSGRIAGIIAKYFKRPCLHWDIFAPGGAPERGNICYNIYRGKEESSLKNKTAKRKARE